MIEPTDTLRAEVEKLITAACEEQTEDPIQSIEIFILTVGRGRRTVAAYFSGSGAPQTCPPPPHDSLLAQAARTNRFVIETRDVTICAKKYLPEVLLGVKGIAEDLSLTNDLAGRKASGSEEEPHGPISAAVEHAKRDDIILGKAYLVLEPAASVAEELPEHLAPACETLTAGGKEYILCGCSARQLRKHPATEMHPDNRDEMLLAVFTEKLKEESMSEKLKEESMFDELKRRLGARGISKEDLGGGGRSENGK